MTEAILQPEIIDVSQIVTEDDEPVDNLFSAYQQRLLVEPLSSNWNPERPFLANANVGIFESPTQPPIVPDMWLSLDVEPPDDWLILERRAYFMWEFLKAPDVVVELVSNRKGGEVSRKVNRYQRLRIWYYVVYDPGLILSKTPLTLFELTVGGYRVRDDWHLEHIGLRLTLWEGKFENRHGRWLRWCLPDGTLIPTGAERSAQEAARAAQEAARAAQEAARAAQEATRAAQEAARADQEAARADQEAARADQEAARADEEAARAEKLAAKLRALGIDPDA